MTVWNINWQYSGIENAARVREALKLGSYEGSIAWIQGLAQRCSVGSYCESGGICVHLWQDTADMSVHAKVTVSVYSVAKLLEVWHND